RGKFPYDLVPVALELLDYELGETGERALAHFGTCDAQDDRVVKADHHPGGDFGCNFGGGNFGNAAERIDPDRKSAADRSTGNHECTARDVVGADHVVAYAVAAMWVASRSCWKVAERQLVSIAASIPASGGCGFRAAGAGT